MIRFSFLPTSILENLSPNLVISVSNRFFSPRYYLIWFEQLSIEYYNHIHERQGQWNPDRYLRMLLESKWTSFHKKIQSPSWEYLTRDICFCKATSSSLSGRNFANGVCPIWYILIKKFLFVDAQYLVNLIVRQAKEALLEVLISLGLILLGISFPSCLQWKFCLWEKREKKNRTIFSRIEKWIFLLLLLFFYFWKRKYINERFHWVNSGRPMRIFEDVYAVGMKENWWEVNRWEKWIWLQAKSSLVEMKTDRRKKENDLLIFRL